MRKKFRTFMAILLCFLVFGSVSSTSELRVEAMENLISTEELDIDFLEKQIESIEQYQSMLDAFNNESKVRSVGYQAYDSNYGGAYIDDTGDLVVRLVDCETTRVDEIREDTGNYEIKTDDCNYSFNELLMVINTINANLDYLTDCGIVISEMYEDVYCNNVKIGVKDLTNEKERIIRELIDSPCMDVYCHNNDSEEETAIKGGDEVTNSLSGGQSTIGFCATKGGVEGFVIAGHAGHTMYDNFTHAGTTVGYVTDTAYYNNSTADAAFLTKSQYADTTAGISIYVCHSVSTNMNDYPVGTVVFKYGIATEQTYGKVISNYYTSKAGDMYFLSQTTAAYNSEGGDSGGPVFLITDVVNGQVTCKLLGIHRGRTGTDDYAIFTKYYNIVNELGVAAITN